MSQQKSEIESKILDLEAQVSTSVEKLESEREMTAKLENESLQLSHRIAEMENDKQQLLMRLDDLKQRLQSRQMEKQKKQEMEVPTFEFYQKLLGLYIQPVGGTDDLPRWKYQDHVQPSQSK
jgi:chromosome segregation ATPase